MPVKKTLRGAGAPVKIWSDDIDASSIAQLERVAALPIIFKHIAVMPDVHPGRGVAIGSVIATQKAIIPAAVGVDIGCGMMAVKTDLNPQKVSRQIKAIRKQIEKRIPLGFGDNGAQLSPSVSRWKGWQDKPQTLEKEPELHAKALRQLGSLGGGNHFIEICLDKQNQIWAMLHSGSRGVGNLLATRHIGIAQELARHHELPDKNLAYLSENSVAFSNYVSDLNWLQGYAFQNRIEMMERVLGVLAEQANEGSLPARMLQVNCHHNYARLERHHNADLWITRKGAVCAQKGELGIIPGSMGARSFIVRGRGNPESYHSCSHGAGRRMSRSEAKKRFDQEQLAQQTKGIECRKDRGVIDEIPAAYKDIDQVIAHQSDLVEVVAELHQIMCVKG